MKCGLFITATDTGVGKTVVMAALAKLLRAAGRDVGVMKPVATGCVHRREGLVSEEPLAEICPIRLAEPLAPTVAAARAKIELDLAPMWAAWRRLRDAHEVLLIEGIGGILCPITRKMFVADMAVRFALPVLVIARPNLGTINHTALTVEAAKARGLGVAGIVINRYNRDTEDVAEMTAPDEIQRAAGVPVLGLVPDDPATSVVKGEIGEDVLAAIRLLPLGRLF
jgi:dethiobiotin synthetase